MVPIRKRTGMGISQVATKKCWPKVHRQIPKASHCKPNYQGVYKKNSQ